MVKSLEERIKVLEEKIKRLDEAIPKELTCECGRLLTIHEDYDKVKYDGTSHAQCYHCLTFTNVKESKQLKKKWKELKGNISI